MKQIPNLSYGTLMRIMKSVPIVCVEVLIVDKNCILLAKRNIQPFKGMWHFTGGLLHYNEKLVQAAKRIAKKESGAKVKILKYHGYRDYIRKDPRGHLIAHIFTAKKIGGTIKANKENNDLRYFNHVPKDMIEFHKPVLRDVLKDIHGDRK